MRSALQIIHIFGKDEEGRRAFNGGNPKLYVFSVPIGPQTVMLTFMS